MDFRLSGVGDLESPCAMVVHGDLADALRAAVEMLDRRPACDEIEIFAGSRFLRGVRRSPKQLVA